MPELPKFVQALLDPKNYPDSSSGIHPELSRGVTLIQTGISFVFLTHSANSGQAHSAGSGQAGDNVYKVKKPVKVGYLDYSTLEKRRFYCQREVELNRRLCPSVYLGVVRITDDKGKIRIDGEGEVIEYAVKMRYLPREKMLNFLLAGGGDVTPEMVSRVARKIADFHAKAETSPAISGYGSIGVITANAEENFKEAAKYIGNTISIETYRKIKAYTNRFIEANAGLFRKRVAEGRVKDCHGDLHANHVCFLNGICIFDCIEFNDRFRYCDVASEIAFLAMDLDNYGRPDLSNSFVDDYVSFSGDKELLKLLDFYKCYRAYVRGKVESFDSVDPLETVEAREKAQIAARKYFKLAESYTQ